MLGNRALEDADRLSELDEAVLELVTGVPICSIKERKQWKVSKQMGENKPCGRLFFFSIDCISVNAKYNAIKSDLMRQAVNAFIKWQYEPQEKI